ncbi:spore germination protein [Neobacillus drentensis]|uniref:spore germination protein n=1 Tax=Neobacillus drentensis TaxID=220684 RepID=UPI002FFE3D92
MDFNKDGITIGTVSGGIVNFGGAVFISPISVTKTVTGSGSQNTGGSSTRNSAQNAPIQNNLSDLIEIVRRSLE